MAKAIRVPEVFPDGNDALLLNPSGTLVAVFTFDRKRYNRHTLAVYSALDNRPLAKPMQLGDCRGVAFIDDRTLLILDEKRCLRYRPPTKPKAFASFDDGFLCALAAQPGVPWFAVILADDQAREHWQVVLADLKSGARKWTLALPQGLDADGLTLSRDGRLVAVELAPSRSQERSLMVFDAATGKPVQTWYSEREVWAMTFAPDGSLFTFVEKGHADVALVVYELSSGDPVRTLRLPRSFKGGSALYCAPDGSWLDAIDWEGYWVRLDLAHGRVLEQRKYPVALAWSCVAVSANGQVAAGVMEDRTVAVWTLGTDEPRPPT